MKTETFELPKMKDVLSKKTGVDSISNFMGNIDEFDGWLFVMAQTRDSDDLVRHNFETAMNWIGGGCYEVFRIGHWGCGWIEYLAVKENSEAQKTSLDIIAQLKEYPILDELNFSDNYPNYFEDCE